MRSRRPQRAGRLPAAERRRCSPSADPRRRPPAGRAADRLRRAARCALGDPDGRRGPGVDDSIVPGQPQEQIRARQGQKRALYSTSRRRVRLGPALDDHVRRDRRGAADQLPTHATEFAIFGGYAVIATEAWADATPGLRPSSATRCSCSLHGTVRRGIRPGRRARPPSVGARQRRPSSSSCWPGPQGRGHRPVPRLGAAHRPPPGRPADGGAGVDTRYQLGARGRGPPG